MASINAIAVHQSNAEALRAWDGTDGEHWVENETIFDNSLSRFRRRFFDAAAIAPDDCVLDIGCGTGETTRDASRRAPSGSAMGVDLSSRTIEQARRRAGEEGIANARFVQADAQIHAFGESAFDVAISRVGAMFFGDPVAAFTNVARAVKPGGRMVLLVWRSLAENHWVRDFSAALAAGREQAPPPPDAPGPFSLSDPDRVRSILSTAGWTDVALEGVDEPMWFGDSADDADRFVRGLGFTKFMLEDLGDDARTRALDDLRASIDGHQTDEGVLYPSATWIITASRP